MSIQSGFGSVLDHDHIISPDLELYLRSELCCIIMFHTLSSLTVVIIYDVDPTQTHRRAYTIIYICIQYQYQYYIYIYILYTIFTHINCIYIISLYNYIYMICIELYCCSVS